MAAIQAVVMVIGVILITLFFGVLSLTLGLFNPSGNLVHWFARWWGRTLLRLGRIPVRISGLEYIPADRRCVLAANHVSAADIPILFGHLPFQFRPIAKDSLFRIPIMGWAMRLAGYISIDRGSPKKAMRSLKRAAAKLREGLPVLVFPEGTRSRTGELQPFNKGAFLLAIEAGVPVAPIAIIGSYDILVSGSMRIRQGVQVSVVISPPIETQGYDMKDRGRLADEVHAVIAGCLQEAGAPIMSKAPPS